MVVAKSYDLFQDQRNFALALAVEGAASQETVGDSEGLSWTFVLPIDQDLGLEARSWTGRPRY